MTDCCNSQVSAWLTGEDEANADYIRVVMGLKNNASAVGEALYITAELLKLQGQGKRFVVHGRGKDAWDMHIGTKR